MHKINYWGLIGTLLLSLFLGLGAAHYLCGDDLLFQSDLFSLFTYLGGATLVAAPILIVPILIIRFVPRVGGFLGQAFLLTFAMFLLIAFEVALWTNVFNATLRWYHFVPMLLLSAVAVFHAADRAMLLKRTEKLGFVGLALLAMGVPACIGWNHLSIHFAQDTGAEGKHLVYIVLDAFPAQYLQAYNPDASPTTMDEAIENTDIYTGVTTTTPYTNAYFGTFYTGLVDSQNPQKKSPIAEGNLFAELQESGVSTRWISFHRNGYPECCAAAIHDYQGLRSYFLTENFCWIPTALGLNYNVTLNRPAPKNAKGREKRRYALARWLNKENSSTFDNVFTDCVMPQMREVRKYGKSSMTLFHYGWYTAGAEQSKEALTGAQETDDEKKDEFLSNARKNEYRYDSKYEADAELARQHNKEGIEVVGRRYKEFLEKLRSDPQLKDTTVILTADHGSMYGKGRCFYAYHPNQEVIQVLCSVSKPEEESRRDERIFCTTDLTASVLDFFGKLSAFQGEAYSIFQAGPERKQTATLTLNSDQWKEWWLVLIENGKKHWININPEGEGQIISYPFGDYDERPLPELSDSVAKEARAKLISHALQEFNVPPETVHVSFRDKNLK